MLAVVRQSRKVRLSVSGARVTPVKVAVFFQAAQLEARCCRVECGREVTLLNDGIHRRNDIAIIWVMYQLFPAAFDSKSSVNT